jgi:hypothetical protein
MKIQKIAILTLLSIVFVAIIVNSADIDRNTFFVSLPDKWTENTKDDMYSPDSFVFFEGPESTWFLVMVGKKSAGASVDALVGAQRDAWSKKLTNSTITEITKWSSVDGKGYKIEGKMQGIVKSRVTMFGFEKGDNVCLVEEYATLGDYTTYARDFEKLRQTFRLK